ncbi:hypothetical protein N7478_011913 [Penicillium angulare]|uniref:uncharacterized protein n=1 Tax=Penicillium angulare TaxID=116970 RepID=UPI0025405854|nr:uncharacterized protein N7478_011913 [Penicillium angulare]KAJ5261318.1 hypothetical protein N7478_011913 [Penicillium angulare]
MQDVMGPPNEEECGDLCYACLVRADASLISHETDEKTGHIKMMKALDERSLIQAPLSPYELTSS